VAYIFFWFVVDSSQAYSKYIVPIETFKVAVMVPLAIHRNSVLPPIINLTQLTLIKEVLEGITAITGLPPSIGVLAQPGGQLWVDLIKTKLDRELHEYYLQCIFEITVQCLKEAFVGKVEDLSVQTDLENVCSSASTHSHAARKN
jgi:hypothetical protein